MIMSRLRMSNLLHEPRPITKKIGLTFGSHVARHLHFVVRGKAEIFSPPGLFLGRSPSVLLGASYTLKFVDFSL